MKHILLIVLLSLSSSVQSDQECEKYKLENYQALRTTDKFTNERVGYSAREPNHIREYKCVLQESNSVEIFESILADSSLAGKLYAMAGLYHSGSPKYVRHKILFDLEGKEVRTMFGCILGSMSASRILSGIESGNLLTSKGSVTR